MKKILTIIGARPQIIKASAISRAINNKYSDQLTEIIVHTGQHYDEMMSQVFFKEMEIPEPEYNLHVGSGSHGKQSAKMMDALEQLFLKEKPDLVLVYGDTNSTMAGALAAAKIHIPLVHIEAGLRSFNKSMPEEINRIVTDHVSTLLFSPTLHGIQNLKKEGFNLEGKGTSNDDPGIFHCGDIMYDNSMYFADKADDALLDELELIKEKYILCTIHRDNNTDQHDRLQAILKALEIIALSDDYKIVLPIHPRTKNALINNLNTKEQADLFESKKIKIIEPVGFFDMITLEKNAKMIITDSGGVQKEAYFFNKPCIILRSETEWLEIVENGKAFVADADTEQIVAYYNQVKEWPSTDFPKIFGDGKAAEFICQKIVDCI